MADIKGFWFRVRVFCWYILTEPIRQMKIVWRLFKNTLDMFTRLATWMHLLLVFGIVFLLVGDKKGASLVLFALLVAILLYEWQSGHFMHRYRQKLQKKVNKETNGGNKNGK